MDISVPDGPVEVRCHMKEKVDPNSKIFKRKNCKAVGPDGMIAPESLQYRVYSPASDIWQLGCILCR